MENSLAIRDQLLRIAQNEDGLELWVRDATGQDVACTIITINSGIGNRLNFYAITDKNLGIRFVTPAKPPTPEQRLTELLEILCGMSSELPEPVYQKFKDWFNTMHDVRDNTALHAMVTGTMTLDELRQKGFDIYSLVEGAVEDYEFYRLPVEVQMFAIKEKLVLSVYRRASEVRDIIQTGQSERD